MSEVYYKFCLFHVKSQNRYLDAVHLFALSHQNVTLGWRAVKNGEVSAGVWSLLFQLALVVADTGLVPALALFAPGGSCRDVNPCPTSPLACTHSCALL